MCFKELNDYLIKKTFFVIAVIALRNMSVKQSNNLVLKIVTSL